MTPEITHLTLAGWQMMHMLGAPPKVTLFRSVRGDWYEDRITNAVLWTDKGNVTTNKDTIAKLIKEDHAVVDEWIDSFEQLSEMIRK